MRFAGGFLLSLAIPTLAFAQPTVVPSMQQLWTATADRGTTSFGYAIASAGDVDGDGFDDVLVGAPNYWYSSPCCEQPGRVYLYRGTPTGLTPSWFTDGDTSWASFGTGVAGGDFNGDGLSDVAYSAGSDSGVHRVFVHNGSKDPLSYIPSWTWSQQVSGNFGPAIASAGDVNGDGFDDLFVLGKGTAFVFHGSATGLSVTPSWTRLLGRARPAGDVNGDGFDDLLAGEPTYSNPESNEGRVLLYAGSPAGLGTVPVWTAESNVASARWGSGCDALGDVNGDGFDDLLLGGESGFDGDQVNEGRIRVFHGASTWPTPAPNESIEGNLPNKFFGTVVSAAGDVNGDGFDDVIAGVAVWPTSYPDPRAVWLFLGSATGLFPAPPRMFNGTAPDSPWIIGPAGDVDGDGYADVLAATFYAGQVQAAYAYGGFPTTPVGAAGTAAGLDVAREPSGSLTLTWDGSCQGTDGDYEIYEGQLGLFASHVPRFCGTGRVTTKSFPPASFSSYYLVVPRSADREGSYGTTSAGVERPAPAPACLIREIASCP